MNLKTNVEKINIPATKFHKGLFFVLLLHINRSDGGASKPIIYLRVTSYIQQTGSRFLIQFGKVGAVGRRSIDFRTEWCNFGCKVYGRILASSRKDLSGTCDYDYRIITQGYHSLGYD